MASLKNELSWSFSRHKTLQACPRRYYFRHYRHWGGWEEGADAMTREAYRLSKLEHRPTWQGSVVHRVIARSLQAARLGRPVSDPEAVIEEALGWMRQDYRDSRDDVARRSGDFKRHVRFAEHEYKQDDGSPHWRGRWKESADIVTSALRSFFASDLYGFLARLADADWMEIEEPDGRAQSFDAEGVVVWVKVDCAFREGGKPVLVDWKTGRTDGTTDIQLAAYGLYMQQRHGIEPGELVAREVNVVTGRTTEHDVGPEALAVFRDVLGESIGRMRSYLADVRDNVPKAEGEFAFTRDERECRYCDFRGICPKVAPAF